MTEVWTPYPGYDHPILFDSRGHRRTGSLFFETTQDKNLPPVFTLKDYDTDLPSVYQLYMQSIDEYDAAMKLVGSMTHWRKLLQCSWFIHGDTKRLFTGVAQWRKDMMARDLSQSKNVLLQAAKEGDMAAAKFLVTHVSKEMSRVPEVAVPEEKTPRRGAQTDSAVIDINSRFSQLMEKNSNGN